MARILAIVAIALLVGASVGFALGRGGDRVTTTIIKRTTTVQPTSRSDELREQFGISTDEDACEDFGIPADACP